MDDATLTALADHSPLRTYDWPDRGTAPRSYLKGLILCFARAYAVMTAEAEAPTPAPIYTPELNKAALDAVHRAIATATDAVIGKPTHDVFAWYANELTAGGAATASPTDRLIAIFSILTGLGMRESSGRFCVGADTPKSRGQPTTPENAEAGLFQVSWDSIDGDSDRQALFDAFKHRTDLKDVFSKGITCSGSDLDIHGDGEQAEFQTTMKGAPLFAALYTASFLRKKRGHWGPILNRAVEVKPSAVTLFKDVAGLLIV